ncbi:MAG TPA: hypothetical protein VF157_06060 [Chloroflexota bacterium]
MADPISAVNSVQLGILQAPEIAREQIPITAQSQLANAQAPAVIAQHDEQARETVQVIEHAENPIVRDALSGPPNGQLPAYNGRRDRRGDLAGRAVPLAAAHPRGLGALVDLRA